MSNDTLGDRMKQYEDVWRLKLPIRTPVIIRIDGKAFHTYTSGCKKPVDEGLVECMNDAATALCEEVQGCKLAYVQSDEISLLVTNYESLDTQSWFENNLQKMVSISAAVASVMFTENSYKIWGEQGHNGPGTGYDNNYSTHIIKPATFDARAFIIPKEEVCNYFLWRQQDATRNSVQMLARSLYSHKECTDKNNSQLQEMTFQKGINWNDCPTSQKRGRCLVKKSVPGSALNKKTQEVVNFQRSQWVVDNEIPIFSVDRNYIDRFVFPEKQ